ncbi:MAG: hypothetical protein EB127_15455 [Alphaproteobacteria bacterium]|nr:hypothetical protein [Alphaproteobacteria bacterium]
MIKIPFYTLNKFPKLINTMRPFVDDLMNLPLYQREAETKKILKKFNIPVDDKKEWCIWENDRDYTMFILRWS